MISLKLKNEARILQAFRNAPQDMAKELQKAVQKTALETSGIIREKIIPGGIMMWKPPIKTGMMRRGIQVREVKPLQAIIRPSTDTPYALFVHEGTRRMKARPFFEITAKVKGKEVQKFFEAVIANVIKKLKF